MDYLNAYEFGYCMVRPARNEYELLADSLESNKLIVNMIENVAKDEKMTQNLLFGNGLNIGYDLYSEEEIDYYFLEKLKNREIKKTKNKDTIWNVNYDANFNILLRPPRKCEYKYLKDSMLCYIYY